jgi:hypothetical protein
VLGSGVVKALNKVLKEIVDLENKKISTVS